MTHSTQTKPTLTDGFNFVTFVPRAGGLDRDGFQRFIALGQNPGEPLGTTTRLRAVEGYYHPENYRSASKISGHIRVSQLVALKEAGRFQTQILDLEHDHDSERSFVETLKAHNPFWFVNAPPIPLGHDYTRSDKGVYEIKRASQPEGKLHLLLDGEGDDISLWELKETPGVPSISTEYILGDPTLQL